MSDRPVLIVAAVFLFAALFGNHAVAESRTEMVALCKAEATKVFGDKGVRKSLRGIHSKQVRLRISGKEMETQVIKCFVRKEKIEIFNRDGELIHEVNRTET